MKISSGISRTKIWLKLICILLIFFCYVSAPHSAELRASHDLKIELLPVEKKLIGRDKLSLKTNGIKFLEFSLSDRISNLKIEIDGQPRNFDFNNGRLRVNLEPDEQNSKLQVSIHYSGIFDDPVPIRPLNTDNPGFGVSGTISQEGSFLLAGAGWYPELAGSRATYKVEVIAPAGLIAVTAGRSLGHLNADGKTVSIWEINYPVEGLSLSVAPYIVETKSVGKIMAATYLLPQNQHLAKTYLEATARYLSLFSNLFGPYPFQKFAVVENFFPTGFGFPSYTLMGGRVLRLPFIVHTSLGHEIAHCWWGNGVYVDYATGNWCEGLTTYIADYRFKEMKSPKDALDYRRQWMRNFATLVRPETDMTISQFRSRYNPVSKTIGYDKAAMVFHMIRQIVGEEAFWGALRDIYRDRLFQRTSWSDLQHAFEARAKVSLQEFFDQWVNRKGAPQFSLESVKIKHNGDKWKVSGHITQEKPYYSFPLNLAIATQNNTFFHNIDVSAKRTTFELLSDQQPQKLIADPDYDIFRQLYPSEIPSAVNALKSSPSVVTVLPNKLDPDLERAASALVISLGLKQNQFVAEDQLSRSMLYKNDILLIGPPRDIELLQKIPATATIGSKSFSLNNVLYEGTTDAFFGVFHHPYAENRIAALFMPLSPQYAEVVATKITHYGKYSYLAFRSGRNQAKGFWPVQKSPLIYEWN